MALKRPSSSSPRRPVAPSSPAPSTLEPATEPVIAAPAPATEPVAAGPVPEPDPQPPSVTDLRPFSSTSFWNAPLGRDAELDPLSTTYTADLRRQLTQWLPWINTTEYSSPVYTVPADQPTVRVALDNTSVALQAAWEQVPIPPGARPAKGTDQTMVVWQPSTDTMWEFWRMENGADGWRARWGGRMKGVSSSPGHYTNPPSWGATATSLPMLGGLIRTTELEAGRIDHALALALPETRARVYSWPAQRTDGRLARTDAIPQGTRFRIDPNIDLSQIAMARPIRAMAEAAQRYGIVVRDTAGAVAFYAEDPSPTGTDPYSGPTGLFGGRYPSELLAQFPWAHLQALKTDLRTQAW